MIKPIRRPIFEAFYNSGGSEAIMAMNNFSIPEFMKMGTLLAPFVSRNWNVGGVRGAVWLVRMYFYDADNV